jgi:hypothetical protein
VSGPPEIPPPSARYPLIRFIDAPATIEFVERAVGFVRRELIENPDGTIASRLMSGTYQRSSRCCAKGE